MVASVREGVMSTHLHSRETSSHVNPLFITSGASNQSSSYEVTGEQESTSAHNNGVVTANQMRHLMSLQSGVPPNGYIHHVKGDHHLLENGKAMNTSMHRHLNGKRNTPECQSTQFLSNPYAHTNRYLDEQHSYVETNQFDCLNDADTNVGHFSEAITMEGRCNHGSVLHLGEEQTPSQVLYIHMMGNNKRNEPSIGDPSLGDSLKRDKLLWCNGVNGGVLPSILRSGGRQDVYEAPSMGHAQVGVTQLESTQVESTQQGSTQQGSTQQGSTQQGNTQLGSTQQGKSQTAPC
ncbi:hypothetical protein PVX_100620 [Plasmodium vivax]|uniref:Uncharacterized protein n=2 Tax=Plasmodium vivax TaxID=5855 RepID=A5K8J7_PLAVS|nr:hypothetical protein PVX_100620 [Plasmodium vivax]EDL44143.1 hypothetical protein PVX_100620 [Plasmodium vivax]KMZ84589.1 hypothetical protein PVBG_00369 [Plasmodium vivax Brazil I]|eukprot:XP_001613870.1 hypothetical protein [Plasmodium vivax Sal-1]